MADNYILILMLTVAHEKVHLDSQLCNFMVYHNLVGDTPYHHFCFVFHT